MKRFRKSGCAIGLVFTVSMGAVAKPPEPLSQLNQLDATEQQRQQQHQQAQQKQFQAQTDSQLTQVVTPRLSLPNNEYPCYPIHHISLVDYGQHTSQSQFQWALASAMADLALSLPHCLGGEGLGVLMKQVQNKIIEQGVCDDPCGGE